MSVGPLGVVARPNVLYAVTPGSFLKLDHDTVRVEVDGATTLRVPLLRLSAIVCFGSIGVSPQLIERCAADGRSVVVCVGQLAGDRFRWHRRVICYSNEPKLLADGTRILAAVDPLSPQLTT